jgi:hypothetical protein
MSNPFGECRLCGSNCQLVSGHVWPAFCYKRYVLDLKKGGRFGDLMKLDWNNHHYKEHWFCSRCDNDVLSAWEKYAAGLCDQFKKGAAASYAYTASFLPFVVSISWRVAMLHLQRQEIGLNAEGKASLGKWRTFLRLQTDGVLPYSHHAFVAFDQEDSLEMHNGIGGEVYPADGCVVSHIGPLFFVGWLDKGMLDATESAIWARSEVSSSGGEIVAVETQESCTRMVAPTLFKLLEGRQERTIEAIVEHGKRKGLLE